MSRHPLRLGAAAALLAAGALALAGCAGESGSGSGSGSGEGRTFESIYGTTTIDATPTRVATWGWGATDAVLALGVMPVAIPSDDYTAPDTLVSPWNEQAIENLGGEPPVILDNSAFELPVEELLATDPDVLIAPYSGLTEEEYQAVTDAGIPVIAPEEALWTTPWQDVITITGDVLGLADEATAVLDGVEQEIADAAAAHPEFAGQSILFVTGVDPVYVYLAADPRVVVLEELGFTTPDALADLDTGESTFYTTVSAESLDQLDSDVVITYAADDAELDTFLGSSSIQLIPAVAAGRVAPIVGVENISALTPTALATSYGLPGLVDALAAAVATAQG